MRCGTKWPWRRCRSGIATRTASATSFPAVTPPAITATNGRRCWRRTRLRRSSSAGRSIAPPRGAFSTAFCRAAAAAMRSRRSSSFAAASRRSRRCSSSTVSLPETRCRRAAAAAVMSAIAAAERTAPDYDHSFLGHPRGLAYLAFTEAWERFSYYGMQTLLVLYMAHQLLLPGHVENIAGFVPFRAFVESLNGGSELSVIALSSAIFGLYTSLVYVMPI